MHYTYRRPFDESDIWRISMALVFTAVKEEQPKPG